MNTILSWEEMNYHNYVCHKIYAKEEERSLLMMFSKTKARKASNTDNPNIIISNLKFYNIFNTITV
jgi:hypothetical protein